VIYARKGNVTICVEINGKSPIVEILEPSDPVWKTLASALELLLRSFLEKLHYVPSYTAAYIVFLQDNAWEIISKDDEPQEEYSEDVVF
jgi:hypothetical protein